MIKQTLVTAYLLLATACSSDKPAPQAQQPIIVQAAPAPVQNNGMQDMLIGGLIGHAMSNRNQVVTQQPATIINRTVINKTYARPSPRLIRK